MEVVVLVDFVIIVGVFCLLLGLIKMVIIGVDLVAEQAVDVEALGLL